MPCSRPPLPQRHVFSHCFKPDSHLRPGNSRALQTDHTLLKSPQKDNMGIGMSLQPMNPSVQGVSETLCTLGTEMMNWPGLVCIGPAPDLILTLNLDRVCPENRHVDTFICASQHGCDDSVSFSLLLSALFSQHCHVRTGSGVQPAGTAETMTLALDFWLCSENTFCLKVNGRCADESFAPRSGWSCKILPLGMST